MSFAQGLYAGSMVAKDWIDAYESADLEKRKRLAQGEISELGKQQAEPSQPSIMRQPQAAPAAPSTELGTGLYGGEDYTSIGLQRGAPAPATAPAPLYSVPQAAPARPVTAQPAPAAAGLAPQQGVTYNTPTSNRLMQEAEIYGRHGLTDQAQRLRDRSFEVGRLEKSDQRAEEEYAQKVKMRQANEAGVKALGDILAKGGDLDLPTIYKTANELGADPAAMTSFVGDSLGITDKLATAKVAKMEREVRAAASDPTKLNEYIRKNADPNPNDNIIPELRQVKGGWAIMYGDKLLPGTQVYADSKNLPGFQALAADMVEKAKGNPLGWTIQKLALEKASAEINKLNADASYSSSLRGLQSRTREFVDEKGNSVILDMSRLPINSDGTYQIPANLKPKTARTEPSDAAVASLAKEFVDKPTGRLVDGKPQRHTIETATAAARAALSGQEGAASVANWGQQYNTPSKAAEKPATAEPTTEAKPNSEKPTKAGLEKSNFYSSENTKARAAARAEEDRRRAEAEAILRQRAEEEAARNRAAIAANFNQRYGLVPQR